VGRRDDDELISYILTGLQIITRGAERALRGNDRFWAYDDDYFRRRRAKNEILSAGPPEVVNPLIERVDRAAGEHAMAYEALLTAQEVADFLGLEQISVQNLTYYRHVNSVKVGNKVLISLGELRRYLEEGPACQAVTRSEWRPLVEEFPGRRKLAELEARTEVLRQKYDGVTIKDLRDILEVDWSVIDRLERRGVIQSFPIEEPNSWRMVKQSEISVIEAYLREEEERKLRQRAERAAQKKEPRIKL